MRDTLAMWAYADPERNGSESELTSNLNTGFGCRVLVVRLFQVIVLDHCC